MAHLMGKQQQPPLSNSPATTPTSNATTAAMPIPVKNGAAAGNNGGGGVIISPRYKEFKTYSSTFDGLQALEQSQAGATAAGGSMNGIHLTGNLASNDVDEHMARNLVGKQQSSNCTSNRLVVCL